MRYQDWEGAGRDADAWLTQRQATFRHLLYLDYFVEETAFAPAIAISSSTCGESPLTPTAPTTFELIKIGTPPCSGVASARASAATRPSRICSSNTRLGRR